MLATCVEHVVLLEPLEEEGVANELDSSLGPSQAFDLNAMLTMVNGKDNGIAGNVEDPEGQVAAVGA